MTEEPSASGGERAAWSRLAAAILAGYAVHASFAIATERHLFGDGAYFLARALSDERPLLPLPGRVGVDLLTQSLLWAALAAGIRDLEVLTFAFGAGCFAIPWACVGLTWWMTRRAPERLLFPLATFAGAWMATDLLACHESIVASALFWVTFFGLLDPERRLSTLATAAGCAVPWIAGHESALLLSPIVIVAAATRWRHDSRAAARLGVALVAAFGVAAFGVAAASVASQRGSANFATFQASWTTLFGMGGPASALCFLFLLGGLVGTVFPRIAPAATAFGASIVCASYLIDPDAAAPGAYESRILNVVWPAVGGAALVSAIVRGGAPVGVHRRPLLAILAAGQFALQIGVTSDWRHFLAAIERVQDCHVGAVPIRPVLGEETRRLGLPQIWTAEWSLPTLSLVARAGQIRSVLDDSPRLGWRPFDPRIPGRFPRLAHVGVDTALYAAWLTTTAEEPPFERRAECEAPGGIRAGP